MEMSLASNVSFTSVVPVRVYIDGLEAADNINVQKGCRKLIDILAGPCKNNQKNQNICRTFAQHDIDFNFQRSLNGYRGSVKEAGRLVKKTASYFFRFINSQDKNFLLTGLHAEGIAERGKRLGMAKAAANNAGIHNSFELMEAKKVFGDFLHRLLNNRTIRIREGYEKATRENTGNETMLNIYLSSNKRYGKKDFKMDVDNISFTPFAARK